MEEIVEKEMIDIENMIYEIRGVQVILSRDVARFYRVETKQINEVIKRNINRFPLSFCFQLTIEEINIISSRTQNATSNSDKKGLRRAPYCFTEQACYMVASVIKNKKAIETSISIMDAFVEMKHNLNENREILSNKLLLLENKVNNNTNKINELFLKCNSKKLQKEYILFDGQFYDAYSIFIDILNKADDEIIIIDNYAWKELLDILKNINKNIIIISKNIDTGLKNKYEKQYDNVDFINKNIFHDRFLIIDKKLLYSFGASFKDLGKKCFSINEMESVDLINILLSKIYTE